MEQPNQQQFDASVPRANDATFDAYIQAASLADAFSASPAMMSMAAYAHRDAKSASRVPQFSTLQTRSDDSGEASYCLTPSADVNFDSYFPLSSSSMTSSSLQSNETQASMLRDFNLEDFESVAHAPNGPNSSQQPCANASSDLSTNISLRDQVSGQWVGDTSKATSASTMSASALDNLMISGFDQSATKMVCSPALPDPIMGLRSAPLPQTMSSIDASDVFSFSSLSSVQHRDMNVSGGNAGHASQANGSMPSGVDPSKMGLQGLPGAEEMSRSFDDNLAYNPVDFEHVRKRSRTTSKSSSSAKSTKTAKSSTATTFNSPSSARSNGRLAGPRAQMTPRKRAQRTNSGTQLQRAAPMPTSINAASLIENAPHVTGMTAPYMQQSPIPNVPMQNGFHFNWEVQTQMQMQAASQPPAVYSAMSSHASVSAGVAAVKTDFALVEAAPKKRKVSKPALLTEDGKPFPKINSNVAHSSQMVKPDVSGLSRGDARRTTNRYAAGLSRRRRAERLARTESLCRILPSIIWKMWRLVVDGDNPAFTQTQFFDLVRLDEPESVCRELGLVLALQGHSLCPDDKDDNGGCEGSTELGIQCRQGIPLLEDHSEVDLFAPPSKIGRTEADVDPRIGVLQDEIEAWKAKEARLSVQCSRLCTVLSNVQPFVPGLLESMLQEEEIRLVPSAQQEQIAGKTSPKGRQRTRTRSKTS